MNIFQCRHGMTSSRITFHVIAGVVGILSILFLIMWKMQQDRCREDDGTKVERQSQNELNGLVTAIRSIEWRNRMLAIHYSLRRNQHGMGIYIKGIPYASVHFYTNNGEAIGSETDVQLDLPTHFLNLETDSTVVGLMVSVPDGAAFVTVRFCATSLVTKPIPLPPREREKGD